MKLKNIVIYLNTMFSMYFLPVWIALIIVYAGLVLLTVEMFIKCRVVFWIEIGILGFGILFMILDMLYFRFRAIKQYSKLPRTMEELKRNGFVQYYGAYTYLANIAIVKKDKINNFFRAFVGPVIIFINGLILIFDKSDEEFIKLKDWYICSNDETILTNTCFMINEMFGLSELSPCSFFSTCDYLMEENLAITSDTMKYWLRKNGYRTRG